MVQAVAELGSAILLPEFRRERLPRTGRRTRKEGQEDAGGNGADPFPIQFSPIRLQNGSRSLGKK